MKKEFERRDFLFEVRAEQDDSGSILTGRPIVYNSKTDLGCFDESTERDRPDRREVPCEPRYVKDSARKVKKE